VGEVRKGGVEVEGQLVSGVAGVRSLQAVGGGGSALGQAVGGVRKAGEEDRGGRWADDTKVAARRSGGGGWRLQRQCMKEKKNKVLTLAGK
jgi:hypothetical protein